MSLSKLLLACSFALASMTLAAGAHADNATPANASAKKSVKKAGKSKAAAKPVETKAPDEDADEPAVTDSAVTEFDCELGNKITIYENAGDEAHIALRWKKRLHRLTRVGTTTGAHRFENKLYGLIWIGIPSKGMLLDSKQNRQLANECRNAEQLKPVTANAAEPTSTKTTIQ
ncbi:hypothetical protein Jab_2c20000 [Janthinobacterium sp. HH01]|uniref:hypothetical protein n=1 Tax=Janthinobacterium sp. HH01 TaxID=1198452 RepID=UPI0002AE80C7|nr:hypothetical protein [Janthinobacterium sp. HH01]ELX09916.1 hypothetical protein Jab_2c20000 [Janthinobacterium sp. HH01]